METIKGWYKNIGEKIKMLAIIMFLVVAVVSIIMGIAIIIAGIVDGYGELIGGGLVVMLVGPIWAYISSWVLYAFGDIAVNCKRTADNGERKINTDNYKDEQYDDDELPDL